MTAPLNLLELLSYWSEIAAVAYSSSDRCMSSQSEGNREFITSNSAYPCLVSSREAEIAGKRSAVCARVSHLVSSAAQRRPNAIGAPRPIRLPMRLYWSTVPRRIDGSRPQKKLNAQIYARWRNENVISRDLQRLRIIRTRKSRMRFFDFAANLA
jgi:hypothetical protein